MPYRQLPSNEVAPHIYALVEAIDALPPVLQRAESAFDQLVTGITDTTSRIGAALSNLQALPIPSAPANPASPSVYETAFDPLQDDMLQAGAERLVLEHRITDALDDQAAASEALALGQERAARESGAAWGRLSEDIVGQFETAFAGIADDGAELFSGLWGDLAHGLKQSLSAIDWDGMFGQGAGGIASLIGDFLPSGGGTGLLDLGTSLLSGFLPGGFGPGSGGSMTSLFGGGTGTLPIGMIAAAATAGLTELFKDEDFPFAKAVIGIERGRPTAESAFELDGGPLDALLDLQSRVIGTLDAMTDRIGAAFSGSVGNFLQIGYASGRKSHLPEGYFVAGLESSGDFATGADLTGIEDEEELIARAVQLALAKALREGQLGGFSDDPGTDARARKTFSDGLERLLAAPFEDLESSLRRIEFLAGFEETVTLYRDGAESLDAYNRALRRQRTAIEETGRAAASEAIEPVRLFVEDARVLFGAGPDGQIPDQTRLEEAGSAVRGMIDELLDSASLAGAEKPLEGFALLYEQQRAQIAALVPELEALNQELETLGLETVDVAGQIDAANEQLAAEVRGAFVTALEDGLSPGRAAARQAVEERDSLLRQAEQLGLENDQSVLDRIDANLAQKLDQLGYTLDESGNLVETFADSIGAATAGLNRQIAAQEDAVGDFARLAETLRDARADFALDGTLSPHSPLDRLARAQSAFARVAEASAAGDLEARAELADSARDYLSTAREVHASGAAYAEIFEEVDATLAAALSSTETQISTAERQLDVLIEIRDRLGTPAADGGALSFSAGSGGQYVSDGGGPVASGYDLGFNPERNAAILTALVAAGLPLPSGFGEGQLARLRQENAAVDAVVSAMGFAAGGIMTSTGPALAIPQSGGIALEPSVAIFGEGSLPEAYVPLPDGRTIPVTLSQPANDGPDRDASEGLRQQHADNRDLLRELKRLNGEVAALREDNERLGRLLGRSISRQSA